MNQNLRRILKYTCCVLLLLFVFTAISTGDVGNFNDYDSSSWNSSSGESWSSSSDSSSSGSSSDVDATFLFYLFLLLWDAGPIGKILIFVIGCAVVWYLSRSNLHRQLAPSYAPSARRPDLPDHTQDITQAIRETDPAFNATAFLEWAKEVFLKLQEAWMERDWEQVRTFESPELYAQHERQLKEYKRLGRINILERININNAYFFSLTKDQEWETLSVVMNVRMVDYIIDEHSRQVLKGDTNRDCFLSYFYVFKRKAGVQTTTAKQEAGTIACPNCGAPTHVVSSGKCEYCNFVITVKDHGWVLTDIIGIKPPYNYGPGGVTTQTKPEE